MKPLPSVHHPIWLCGFRPFFLAAALSLILLIPLWLLFLSAPLGWSLPLPQVPGGATVWHAHELLFGFVLAALAGFVLTAVPEFTAAPAVPAAPVRLLALFWLLGRLGFWCSGWLGKPALLLAGLSHLALVAGLLLLLAPRIWQAPERRHLSFIWAMSALFVCIAGFYTDTLRDGESGAGVDPARWLHAMVGLMMIFIVLALSRISMRIVNQAIDDWRKTHPARQSGTAETDAPLEYRARPPKRNLAISCIAAYTVAEFFLPESRLSGWLALAAAAALLHLHSDWHIGRPLLQRWPLILFGVYLLMAAGYALIGAALVFGVEGFSAGRHLLTIGAMGLAIYCVFNIAGRIHCGHPMDERGWIPLGAALLVLAALLRAAPILPAVTASTLTLYQLAAVALVLPYAYWLRQMWPLLTQPRSDGLGGCDDYVASGQDESETRRLG
ncbi:MAG: NnrS family protein [Sterolibacterium sp.]|nr:NnrS family protein [Sterolibacterium sp.]